MDIREELLTEILIRVRKNCTCMAEIERMTKEIAEAFSREDKESVSILLNMRKKEIDSIAATRNELHVIVEAQDKEIRSEIEDLFFKEEKPKTSHPLCDKIWDMNRQMIQMKKDILTIDEAMSKKIARTDSFYQG